MSSTTEQIKERLDIVDVISGYLKLDKAGVNFKARCPFHNEKTASFFVSKTRQSYHCFGCDKGGDMFSFIQDIEGIDFSSSLKTLASRAGVSIGEYENKQLQSEREDLLVVMKEATEFFEENLKSNKDVIEYLKKRGLTGKTAKEFQIGFANDSWDALFTFLKNKGFKESIIEKAGLIIPKDNGYYDRFRSRIMFPIRDNRGMVVAFSGRIFSQDNSNTAKYINSPETPLYNKSKILFGFDKAKTFIRKEDFCLLVEGQMDLLMSYQSGVINTVAVSGTALSSHHLTVIGRLTNNIIIAFDPDDAGMNASKRGIDLALSMGMDVRAVNLPTGCDPADLILEDEKKWLDQVKNAAHIIDFYIKILASKYSDQRDFRIKVGEIVLPYVALLKNKINQAHFVAEIARRLGISEEPVWEELKSLINSKKNNNQNNSTITTTSKDKKKISTKIEEIERKILGTLFWQDELKSPVIDVGKVKEKYRSILRSNGMEDAIDKIDETTKKALIFESELYYEEQNTLEKTLDDLILYLEQEILKTKRDKVKEELRLAENKDDYGLADSLLKKYQNISKKINSLK